jgi:hypothetical protein
VLNQFSEFFAVEFDIYLFRNYESTNLTYFCKQIANIINTDYTDYTNSHKMIRENL